ncbi:MAG: hypothetical protein Kow0077_14420 [Anaerolineae bacterium]
MSEEQNLEQLLREGARAARQGQKEVARAIFQQIVAQDPENEQAWYWLAAVVETDRERVAALRRVLKINPQNTRAREILNRLKTQQEEVSSGGGSGVFELLPGIDRRTLMIGGGVIGALVVLIIMVVIILTVSNNNARRERDALAAALTATEEKIVADAAATQAMLETVAVEAVQTGQFTGPAVVGRPTLPPTWTPIGFGEEQAAGEPTTVPSALGSGLFTGRLLGVSGQDLVGNGFVPVVEIPLDGSPPRTLFDGRGGYPDMAPQEDRLVYTVYSTGTREQGLQIAWLDGSREPQLLAQLLGTRILQKQDYASFSPDGSRLAFMAREPGNTNNDIYVVSLLALNPQGADAPALDAVLRLTDGAADSRSPTWGDSTRLVYVHDASSNGGPVDLKLVDLSGQSDFLTTDGVTLLEDHPDISPNGQQVAYSASSPANPGDSDIYIQSLIGGQPLLVVDTPTRAVNPRWSPDGRFIAFASDEDGDFDIYIVEVDTYAVYQVTFNDVHDMVNEWLP